MKEAGNAGSGRMLISRTKLEPTNSCNMHKIDMDGKCQTMAAMDSPETENTSGTLASPNQELGLPVPNGLDLQSMSTHGQPMMLPDTSLSKRIMKEAGNAGSGRMLISRTKLEPTNSCNMHKIDMDGKCQTMAAMDSPETENTSGTLASPNQELGLPVPNGLDLQSMSILGKSTDQ